MTKGLMIAGTSSNSGKTTVTLGLLKALSKKYKVIPFKVGPDYIDPFFHFKSSGKPSYNLDAFMQEEERLKDLFFSRGSKGKLALVEGVMGFFDGLGTSDFASSAHVARILDIPVVLVVDAKGMAKSISALIKGYKDFDSRVKVTGVILNKINSQNYYELLKTIIEKDTNVKVLGYLPLDEEISIPEERLGLVNPNFIRDFDKKLDILSNLIERHIDLESVLQLASPFPETKKECSKDIEDVSKVKIAVAKDEAFFFYYKSALETLEQKGAEICFFSPLHDKTLPENIKGIYIGGGALDRYAIKISQNTTMRQSIKNAAKSGIPLLAEGGGLVYLSRTFTLQENTYPMAGVFDFSVKREDRMTRFGYVNVKTVDDTILGKQGLEFSGHQFSYYSIDNKSIDEKNKTNTIFEVKKPWKNYIIEDGYRFRNVLATLVYGDFYANPEIANNFIENCKNHRIIGEDKF